MATKFVSVEDFAIRAGLGDVDDLADDVTAKAQASIEAATTHLVSILRTTFDEQTPTDQYYVDTGELPFVGEFPRFFLSQGFVTTATSGIAMRIASTLADLAAASNTDAAYFVLDQTKGSLLVSGTDVTSISVPSPALSDRYFADITYTAGFTSKSDAYGTIYENTPDWLTEAAMILAKSIFDTGKACKDDNKNPQGCPCSIESLVNRYIRFMPSALKPMS
jgi:hypothetical protein